MTSKRLTLVTDTNLFIQCRALNELPWSELGDFDEINVVVTRPVQKEIDRQKGGNNGRLAKRARTAHSLLRSIIVANMSPIEVSSGRPVVAVSLRPHIAPDPNLSPPLQYDEPDDRIVGIANALADAGTETDVRVFSHDSGTLASAVATGIPYIPIPDAWLLAPEDSKEGKELRAAQSEIERLRRTEPKFEVRCTDREGTPLDRLAVTLKQYRPLTDSEKRELLMAVDQRFPVQAFEREQENAEPSPSNETTTDISTFVYAAALLGKRQPPSEEKIAKYEAEHAAWRSKLAGALDHLHRKLNAQQNIVPIFFEVTNVGTRPAEKVLIERTAQGASLLLRRYRDDDLEAIRTLSSFVAPPAPPKGWSATEMLSRLSEGFSPSHLHRGMDLSLPLSRAQHDPEGFYYREDSQHYRPQKTIELTTDLWRHGREPESFTVYLDTDGEYPASGTVLLRIHAANLTDSVDLRVPVKIEAIEASPYDIARGAIDAIEAEPSD